jgi:hypothetical protein
VACDGGIPGRVGVSRTPQTVELASWAGDDYLNQHSPLFSLFPLTRFNSLQRLRAEAILLFSNACKPRKSEQRVRVVPDQHTQASRRQDEMLSKATDIPSGLVIRALHHLLQRQHRLPDNQGLSGRLWLCASCRGCVRGRERST